MLRVPAGERDTWLRVGMALKYALGEEGSELWDTWSQTTTLGNYVPEHQQYTWDRFSGPGEERRGGGAIADLGTIYHLARSYGWKEDAALQAELRSLDEAKWREQAAATKAPVLAQPEYPQATVPPEKPRKPGLVVTCGAAIKPEPVDWAWKEHFARGKLNLIGGPPGLGKSQLLLHIAKVITTGGTWPGGEQCRLGAVLLAQLHHVAPSRQARLGVLKARLKHASEGAYASRSRHELAS